MDYLIGIIIISICIGYMTKQVYGWLFFGIATIIFAIIEDYLNRNKP